jgi:hypothetical protein
MSTTKATSDDAPVWCIFRACPACEGGTLMTDGDRDWCDTCDWHSLDLFTDTEKDDGR